MHPNVSLRIISATILGVGVLVASTHRLAELATVTANAGGNESCLRWSSGFATTSFCSSTLAVARCSSRTSPGLSAVGFPPCRLTLKHPLTPKQASPPTCESGKSAFQPRKKPSYFPYWLVNGDPYNGLL